MVVVLDSRIIGLYRNQAFDVLDNLKAKYKFSEELYEEHCEYIYNDPIRWLGRQRFSLESSLADKL